MYADQLLANGLDQQCCNNRTVDTAAESQQNLLVTNLFANGCDLLGNESFSQFGGGDTSHGIGTQIVHVDSSCSRFN